MKLRWILVCALCVVGVMNAEARKPRETDKSKKPAAAATTSAKKKRRPRNEVTEPNAGALEGYFPKDGTMKSGQAVADKPSPELKKYNSVMTEGLRKLTPEQAKAYVNNANPNAPYPYDATVWPDKAVYDAYVAEWNKRELTPIATVAMGLQDLGEGKWRLNSAIDKTNKPVLLSSMSYDAERNVWISGTDELKARPYFTSDRIFGEQGGMEWVLNRKDDKSRKEELIRLTKSPDGEYTYLTHTSTEYSAEGNALLSVFRMYLRFKNEEKGAPTSR